MLAAGILLFLLVEIVGEAAEQTVASVRGAAEGVGSGGTAALMVVLLLSGVFVGFVSLVVVERTLIRQAAAVSPARLSFMIALAIGMHNLSEGLAIGQSAAQGMVTLAVGLVVGFAVHNATEGFGILSPMVREGNVVPWGTLLLLGAIGGGPTFVGTIVGSLWTSVPLSVFVLALAGGALIYVLKELVVKELFSSIQQRETAHALAIVMLPLVLGFMIGLVTTALAEGATEEVKYEEVR
jgi:zinc transporter ZupT